MIPLRSRNQPHYCGTGQYNTEVLSITKCAYISNVTIKVNELIHQEHYDKVVKYSNSNSAICNCGCSDCGIL